MLVNQHSMMVFDPLHWFGAAAKVSDDMMFHVSLTCSIYSLFIYLK